MSDFNTLIIKSFKYINKNMFHSLLFTLTPVYCKKGSFVEPRVSVFVPGVQEGEFPTNIKMC